MGLSQCVEEWKFPNACFALLHVSDGEKRGSGPFANLVGSAEKDKEKRGQNLHIAFITLDFHIHVSTLFHS